jgi:hypothetical protein
MDGDRFASLRCGPGNAPHQGCAHEANQKHWPQSCDRCDQSDGTVCHICHICHCFTSPHATKAGTKASWSCRDLWKCEICIELYRYVRWDPERLCHGRHAQASLLNSVFESCSLGRASQDLAGLGSLHNVLIASHRQVTWGTSLWHRADLRSTHGMFELRNVTTAGFQIPASRFSVELLSHRCHKSGTPLEKMMLPVPTSISE